MQVIAILVFLVLPLVVLVVGAILIFAFLKEAFAPPDKLTGNAKVGSPLPLLRGDSLRRWAAELSKSLVAKYTAGRWTRDSAAAVAREVETQASLVIDCVLPRVSKSRSSYCPERGQEPIHVTIPEALAIADELRASQPAALVHRILKQACANQEAGGVKAAAAEGAPGVCPLLSDDGRCLVFAMRPLRCRGRCCPYRGPSPERDMTAAGTAEFSLTVSEGMREGLAAALTAAGLDGHSYDLSYSLAQALGEPNAVDRWARGEMVSIRPDSTP